MSIKYFFTRLSIKFSFFFLEVSDFFHSFPIVFLNPAELAKLNNSHYQKPYIVEKWEENGDFVLSPGEEQFIKKYGFEGARALVIGSGAGRESIALAKLGFQVKAIDSSLSMLEAAARNIEKSGVRVDLLHLSLYEICRLGGDFDMVFLGGNYGMIPTRKFRQKALSEIKKRLKPGGIVYLEFRGYEPSKYAGFRYALYKIIAYLILGNRQVEPGDFILGTGEFYHYFGSMDTVIKEAQGAGFAVDKFNWEEDALFLKAQV
ncbi:MAG: class I SAM-dependent methyltransferase [Candidatus Omnitrophota bacterium]